MAEFDPHSTIAEAIEEQAKGRVKRASDREGDVEYFSIDELIKAKRDAAADTAAGKPHFGLRMTKLVPPGTG